MEGYSNYQYKTFDEKKNSIPFIYFPKNIWDKNDLRETRNNESIYPGNISQNCDDLKDKFLIKNGISKQCRKKNKDDKLGCDITDKNGSDDFIYDLATNNLSNNTEINYDEGTKKWGDLNKNVKKQLKYLGCQVLKDRTSFVKQNNNLLDKLSTTEGAAKAISIFIVFWILTPFILKNIVSPLINIAKGNDNKLKYSFGTFYNSIDSISQKLTTKKTIIFTILIFVVISIIIFIGSIVYLSQIKSKPYQNIYIGKFKNIFFNHKQKDNNNETKLNYDNLSSNFFIVLLFVIVFISILVLLLCFPKLANEHKAKIIFISLIYVIALIYFILLIISPKILSTNVEIDEKLDYNTGTNILQENKISNKNIFILLLIFTVCSFIVYIIYFKFFKKTTPWWSSFLLPFVFLFPFFLFFFELSFAITSPVVYLIVFIGIRAVLYLLAFIAKFTNISSASPILSILFNKSENYFRTLLAKNGTKYPMTNYPKTLPSGMSWNLISTFILKIITPIFIKSDDRDDFRSNESYSILKFINEIKN